MGTLADILLRGMCDNETLLWLNLGLPSQRGSGCCSASEKHRKNWRMTQPCIPGGKKANVMSKAMQIIVPYSSLFANI